MKVAVITCYSQPDYVRALTLRNAVEMIDETELVVVKNTKTGLLRYLEVMYKIIKIRIIQRPDVYLLTFRGYELLLFTRIITIGKPLIYDEFINPVEWAIYEHKKLSEKNPLVGLFKLFYRILLLSTDLILTDTQSHAELSSSLMRVPMKKFQSIPVGADEATFKYSHTKKPDDKNFKVLYYGSMLPLHGLEYVIQAAVELRNEPIEFIFIGGNQKTKQAVETAIKEGANLKHIDWVEFEELPNYLNKADLFLAGPFGGTFQAEYVITGKAYQALAMGRPTVVGENKESGIFQDKQNVLIVPQANSNALASSIRWAWEHQTKLNKMGLAGRQLYNEAFSSSHIRDELRAGLVKLNLLEAGTSTKQ